ncbi:MULTISPECIES: hypothetical protein, partial [unclassified Bradyrhizobium]|uniref:hypothetical protein n=1 Tax=unclassified Bradyrhizobium TaxID=2631580 RepID=UPI0033961677
TSRDFVPWRFLDAGQASVLRVSRCRRPKTCTQLETSKVHYPLAIDMLFEHGHPVHRARKHYLPPERFPSANALAQA